MSRKTDLRQNLRQKDSEILARRALQVQRGAARAAVLGVNDGLVSTLAIVLGVAAAGADQSMVLLAGFAGLIAGSISMAAGEWISVRSQVDLFEGVLNDVKDMIKNDKELLTDNLADNLRHDGYSATTANTATKELSKDPERFYTTYVEKVIGINPDELGSPWVAAISSLVLFTLGALPPLLPWLISDGFTAIWSSIIATCIGGLIVGGYVASSSGKSIAFGAARQFAIIILASLVTYGVGHLFGVTVA